MVRGTVAECRCDDCGKVYPNCAGGLCTNWCRSLRRYMEQWRRQGLREEEVLKYAAGLSLDLPFISIEGRGAGMCGGVLRLMHPLERAAEAVYGY
jgi:hypothetical protein